MRVPILLVIGLLYLDASLGAVEPGPVDAPELNKLGIQYSLRKTTKPIPNRIKPYLVNSNIPKGFTTPLAE